jgi:hypothetical protein
MTWVEPEWCQEPTQSEPTPCQRLPARPAQRQNGSQGHKHSKLGRRGPISGRLCAAAAIQLGRAPQRPFRLPSNWAASRRAAPCLPVVDPNRTIEFHRDVARLQRRKLWRRGRDRPLQDRQLTAQRKVLEGNDSGRPRRARRRVQTPRTRIIAAGIDQCHRPRLWAEGRPVQKRRTICFCSSSHRRASSALDRLTTGRATAGEEEREPRSYGLSNASPHAFARAS